MLWEKDFSALKQSSSSADLARSSFISRCAISPSNHLNPEKRISPFKKLGNFPTLHPWDNRQKELAGCRRSRPEPGIFL